MLKKAFIVILLILPLGLLGRMIISAFGYYDIVNGCNIVFDTDVLRGNRKTIQSAINQIKQTDQKKYKDLCGNVNKIVEIPCAYFEDNTNRYNYYDAESCYVNGSKIIHLKPQEENSQRMIDIRTEAIIKAANKSKEYWQNN